MPSGKVGNTKVHKIDFDLSKVPQGITKRAITLTEDNGTGSFYRYKVSMSIDNHSGTSVTISSKNANNNDRIYTCVPGILHNTEDGVIISPIELYSNPNSEYRPKLKVGSSNMVEVIMDKGAKNDYK